MLCVSPKRLAAEAVRESGCGLALEPEDARSIERAIEELARDPEGWEARHYAPREDVIARFDRRALAGRLAAVLDGVAAGTGSNVR